MEISAYVLQGILAAMFLIAGSGKITGSKMHVDNFTHWRLPQWFRVVTGLVEVASAVALVVGYWHPSWAAAGALVLGLTGVGGVLTHMRVKDPLKQTITILVLGVLAFVLVFIRWQDLSSFPGF
ncbi:hypothetical protein A8F94_19205 [Bacillus sp. FJAT-27225]|uniref:DoxX family protein n=1 Tax=Bacillus sp. FJAT-27225 TaxID=1743144 RepID=UPI00080C323D|nr:DoxX family protein [Bacillus sp. FJAT-27225]OCA83235.1 hypothetical protein A8F94_19205 [Bacillus sp. FJAT-27225]